MVLQVTPAVVTAHKVGGDEPIALARRTTRNKVSNVHLQRRPPEQITYCAQSLGYPVVSCIRRIVSFPYDQLPEVRIIRNDNTQSFHYKTRCIDTQQASFRTVCISQYFRSQLRD
jgi:hypothetical protein